MEYKTYSIKNKSRKPWKVIAVLGVSLAFIALLLLYWSTNTIVNGFEDLDRFQVDRKEVIGASVYCDAQENDIVTNFEGDKEWLLLGDEFSFQYHTLTLQLDLKNSFLQEYGSSPDLQVLYKVKGTEVEGKFTKNDESYTAQVDGSKLTPGEYEVIALIDIGCNQVRSEPVSFKVSYPLYVTWTQDWEGTEINDQYLRDMEKIADDHGIPMTHFFNPRIYVTNAVSPARAQYFTDWVLRRERENGDDIGLHLHMFPDMVSAAGVTPLENPQKWGGRNDGYDILTSDYSEADMIKMFEWSKDIFQEKGLGEPEMYRAGGWFADEETLSAAAYTGFTMDSSGRTSYNLGPNQASGHWALQSTTRPYRLNSFDQNNTSYPNMDLWEFPNNGGDSWEYSAQEMIGRFNDNYDGTPLQEKQVVTYLSHPHWFNVDKPKLEVLFTEIDKNLHSADNGPVIYINLSTAYDIWTLPDGSNTGSNIYP